jgi:DNA-binding HxlR family transcriptional regulator
MTVKYLEAHDCRSSYKILGDFWILRIINTLRNGEKRYCQIERELGDINTATLSKRLAKLQADGLVVRNEISRADVTYELTEGGKLMLPVLNAVDNFSEKLDKLTKQTTSTKVLK